MTGRTSDPSKKEESFLPLVIMGVSGAGKTTIGCEIARLLNLKYEDADNLHSEQSQKKMASGQPLDDDDPTRSTLAGSYHHKT
jgi:carbohydrate kinase (thermoresistant glucokinase family)